MKSHDTWHDVSPPPFFSTSVLASSNKVRNRHYLLIGDMAFFNRVKARRILYYFYYVSHHHLSSFLQYSVANHGAVAVVDATLVTQTATKLWKAVADTYIFALMPFI